MTLLPDLLRPRAAMRYASVCDGIGAVHVAWKPLGWMCAWHAEIEPFPSAVVAHHHDAGPNLGDITKITQEQLDEHGPIDLLVGGTPCQSFSVAGLRGGLDDPRGNLALRFLQLAGATRARWVVWENVPGVLSSWSDEAGSFTDEVSGGARRERGWQTNDFDTFLNGLRKLGYGCAWRIADAEYFGVAQRRRRVFVVGYLGDWRRAAAVLFERDSLSGHSAPSREAWKRVADCIAPSLRASGVGSERVGDTRGQDCLIPAVSPAIKSRDCKGPSSDGDGDGAPLIPVVAFAQNQRDEVRTMDVAGALASEPGMKQQTYIAQTVAFQTRIARNGRGQPKDITDALTSSEGGTHADSKPHVAGPFGVRRLTPRECERLQGFPYDYTAITYRGKPAADGPRYKVLGNSMAVPVVAWIGRRIVGAA